MRSAGRGEFSIAAKSRYCGRPGYRSRRLLGGCASASGRWFGSSVLTTPGSRPSKTPHRRSRPGGGSTRTLPLPSNLQKPSGFGRTSTSAWAARRPHSIDTSTQDPQSQETEPRSVVISRNPNKSAECAAQCAVGVPLLNGPVHSATGRRLSPVAGKHFSVYLEPCSALQ